MNFIKRHPLFTGIIAIFAIVILGEVWLVFSMQAKVADAEGRVQERIDEIERLQRAKPTPNPENVAAVKEEFAQNADALSTMLRVLNVVGADELEFFQGEPATRTLAWFEISKFVDRMQSEAAKSNVQLRPDEHFGFGAYAATGPDPAYIRSVYRQHRIVEYLLQRLFAARPRSLIGVQREEPIAVVPAGTTPPPAAPSAGGGGNNNAGGAGEIFVIDPQVSARTPGYVDTMAFRIVFSGHTSSLRGFMNALSAPDIPLVVRSVEAAPGAENPRAANPPAGTARPASLFGPTPAAGANPNAAPAPAVVPIVAENNSVFTVTVELFEVKIRAPAVATAAAVR